MSLNTWILRFGELGLKSKSVRSSFQRSLRKNMFELAEKREITLFHHINNAQDHVSSNDSVDVVEDLLCRVIGVVAIDRVVKLDCGLNPEEIAEDVIKNSDNVGQKRTFGVRVKRVCKTGNINSREYERRIGAKMISLDSNLSVNLTKPDEWIKLIIGNEDLFQIKYRIQTSGGLPPGVQGDVLIQLNSEKLMLEAFLVMRRGVRLIPVLDSKPEFIEQLSCYDPFIGRRTLEHEMRGHAFDRPAWGIMGLTLKEAEPFIGKREAAVKTTPISTLSPLVGWTQEEAENLLNHFNNPSKNLMHPDIGSWIF
ncbi:MAG: THUMP domain-containing protein [Candidatus Poseidoniaceae archaeon]|nr:THUMP domain-containing protein [Candidatus Poseidoniaceae archaeon]